LVWLPSSTFDRMLVLPFDTDCCWSPCFSLASFS
jgi:hypothetical protein